MSPETGQHIVKEQQPKPGETPYERDPLRQLLFGENNPNCEVDMSSIGLTTSSLARLALETTLKGVTKYEAVRKHEIARDVEAILKYGDKLAHSSEENDSVFGLIDPPKDLARITALTARIIWTWERAWLRQDKESDRKHVYPSPFAGLSTIYLEPIDLTKKVVRLVIETAAGVVETLQAGYNNGSIGSNRSHLLASFIAQQGPNFATEWIRGDGIRNYCDQNGLDADVWLGRITPSPRAGLAIHQPANPLANVQRLMKDFNQLDTAKVKATGLSEFRIIEALIRRPGNPEAAVQAIKQREDMLTFGKIAARVGWGETEVREFFSPKELNEIARGNSDPLAKAEEIIVNFDTVLSLANLQKTFGLSRAKAESLFPYYLRKGLSISHSDPLAAARDAVKLWAELSQDYQDLPESLITYLVGAKPGRARFIADVVRRGLSDIPQGISPKLWAWTLCRHPKASKSTHLQQAKAYIRTYILWIVAHESWSADSGTVHDKRSVHDRFDGSIAPPEEMLLANQPSDYLEGLAEKAGVPAAQIEQLLQHFANNDQVMTDEALQAAMEKIRGASA